MNKVELQRRAGIVEQYAEEGTVEDYAQVLYAMWNRQGAEEVLDEISKLPTLKAAAVAAILAESLGEIFTDKLIRSVQ